MDFLQELRMELSYINKLIELINKNKKVSLNGSLRVSKNRKKYAYYHYLPEDVKDYPCGKYIKKSEISLAVDLAQNEYNEYILSWAIVQKRLLEEFLIKYDPSGPVRILEELTAGKREIITPFVLSDEEYAKRWQEEPYFKADFHRENLQYITDREEYVRSKSEKILADKFCKEGIPYKYECPILFGDRTTLCPDFTLLNVITRKVYYWEHFGLMDNPEYAESMTKKVNIYNNNGIYIGENLIITMETSKSPLNMKIVDLLINHYLK